METNHVLRHLESWQHGAAPTPAEPVTLHFCPALRKAAFLITDHGDRTRVGISRAVYMGHSDVTHPEYGKRGIVPSGIKITQAALYQGWDGFDYLNNAEFLALMREAHRAGIEICPHNTCDHLDITPDETQRQIEFYAAEFGLTSWIDHFRLPSNLTQQGMDPRSPYYILDRFRSHGGRIAWSFVDRFANPPHAQLDMFNPPSFRDYASRLLRDCAAAIPARRLGPRARANVGATLFQIAGAASMGNLIVIRQGPRQFGLRPYLGNIVAVPLNIARHWARGMTPATAGFPLRWDSAHGLYWFDAVRVLFMSDAYTPASLARLIDDCGIHIGHTYLGLLSARYDDCAFEPSGSGGFRVRDVFQRFLDTLATRCREGSLWNPTLRELAGFYDDLSAVELVRGESGWALTNHGERAVAGVTVRSRHRLSAPGHRPDDAHTFRDESWYSFSLPAHREVRLTIDGP